MSGPRLTSQACEEDTGYRAWLVAKDNGMSTRLNNALIHAANGDTGYWHSSPLRGGPIDTFAKLSQTTTATVLRLRGLGRKTLRELRAVLRRKGLYLADDTPAAQRKAKQKARDRERRRAAKAAHRRCRCPWCQGSD